MQSVNHASPLFLVLAAGHGRRFGAEKLSALLPSEPEQTTVLARTLNTLQQVSQNICLVCRENQSELQQQCERRNVHWLRVPENNQGIGESLSFGVRQNAQASGWIICLADMPWVTAETYAAIAAALSSRRIVTPIAPNGTRGNPVGFGSSFLEELSALTGDQGAKSILHRHPEQIHPLNLPDKAILMDIDYSSDINSTPQ